MCVPSMTKPCRAAETPSYPYSFGRVPRDAVPPPRPFTCCIHHHAFISRETKEGKERKEDKRTPQLRGPHLPPFGSTPSASPLLSRFSTTRVHANHLTPPPRPEDPHSSEVDRFLGPGGRWPRAGCFGFWCRSSKVLGHLEGEKCNDITWRLNLAHYFSIFNLLAPPRRNNGRDLTKQEWHPAMVKRPPSPVSVRWKA